MRVDKSIYRASTVRLFDEAMERGYLIKKTNGDVWQTDRWQAGMGIVDFTNPDACKWYQGYLKQLLRHGRGLLQNRLWRAHTRTRHRMARRQRPNQDAQLLYLPVQQNRIRAVEARTRGEGEAVPVRALGPLRAVRQFPVHWGGDNSANVCVDEPRLCAPGLVPVRSRAIGFWSHDISGFESTAPADVYKRWCGVRPDEQSQPPARFRRPIACRGCSMTRPCDVLRHFVKLEVPTDALPVRCGGRGARVPARP